MDKTRMISTILAALELAPAEPSDITGILRDHVERHALMSLTPSPRSRPLTVYLCEQLEIGRIDHWYKHLEMRFAWRQSDDVLIAGDENYPARLAGCWDAPPLLFARGQIHPRHSIAIVGSRDASDDTIDQTRELAVVLGAAGVSVVSGLAAGVDTAAHRGALDAGGHTVAVMGTGIEHVFPESNAALSEEIAEAGALLSQFPPNAPRTGTTFLRRNCVIAGMTDISLIMAGEERSGSRHELEQAISYGRSALMWAPTMRSHRWARDLSDRGLAKFVSSCDEIFGTWRADS
jgi:DNA processing protein